ncbi:hypothetical protein [uncultured Vibrio sp.]|uniref:hypothetical protein n=1 Tax=uncultured Vibrio sp. TaxID=114054 RepID=UPI002629F763|nr:hypothetical protein [uncultured Vibrio sp.]
MTTTTSVPSWVSSTGINLRQAEYFIYELFKNNPLQRPKPATVSEAILIVNQAIDDMYEFDDQKRVKAKELVDNASTYLLPLDEFDWLKVDERCNYWAWIYIAIDQSFSLQVPGLYPVPQFAKFYNAYGLNPMPTNSKERYTEIVRFFDMGNWANEIQRQQLATMKQVWQSIFIAPKPLRWLSPKDEEQCIWAWSYFTSYFQNSNTTSSPPILGVFPQNAKERYLALCASFDAWYASAESKKLFLININKAWHQKKHRDNMKGKKACSFVLHNDVKSQLDELASARRMKKNEYVESLIKDAYKKLTSPSSGGENGD